MKVLWCGSIEYTAAWALQRELAALCAQQKAPNTLLLLQHPPTITLGRGAHAEHVLLSQERLRELGVAVVPVDRGGDVTYHGPGQLVGYPIVRISDYRADLHWFLREIEAALIAVLTGFHVVARRFPPHTGVWVGDAKAAAIGIKVSHWVSTHGFSLNVENGIRGFEWIVPCGIHEYPVTSLSEVMQRSIAVREVLQPVAMEFTRRFPAPEMEPDVPIELLTADARALLAKAVPVDPGAAFGCVPGAQ